MVPTASKLIWNCDCSFYYWYNSWYTCLFLIPYMHRSTVARRSILFLEFVNFCSYKQSYLFYTYIYFILHRQNLHRIETKLHPFCICYWPYIAVWVIQPVSFSCYSISNYCFFFHFQDT